MDKSWMHRPRLTEEYENGLEKFLDFAFDNVCINEKIICPCKNCKNALWVSRETATEHLIIDGFLTGYSYWVIHGEGASYPQDNVQDEHINIFDDMRNLVHDAFGVEDVRKDLEEEPNEEAKAFYKLLDDAQEELYPGCKEFSRLKFIVQLFHLKCTGKWSNKSFTMLLELLKEAFPDLTKSLPESYYEVQKIIGALGLTYVKIDACPNDCILYWKEHASDSVCHVCNTSRYNGDENDQVNAEDSSVKYKRIPSKVLRYFPLKPRLQRLFTSSKTASSMRWHKEGRTKDGLLRHPADSSLWHAFDHHHRDFAKDSRNVRLGLAADGFNPFRTMSVAHSTWPVILTPYNLPPWMSMKEPFFFLTLLIPGPSPPGNNIDVYMQPLIEELHELWTGVDTYDASMKENFNMRAALLWTINDYPAYANLSGWSTKGKLACPSCHKDTCSVYLAKSHKYCYMGHRRFLNRYHPYRKDTTSFDGNEEHRRAPIMLTGDIVADEVDGLNITFGKKVDSNLSLPLNWKKRSIFFDLPYWKDSMLRHNLDVMHIEKNVCESLLGTLLNLEGKSKDHENSRLDLKNMGIRSELHPIRLESGKHYLPAACFTLSKKEKEQVLEILKNVKVPDGYASNISNRVLLKPDKISGLKTHDYHILLHQLLPIALRKVLDKNVRTPLIKLCIFFRDLCSKVLDPRDLIRMEKDIAKTLCDLEKIFPPSFFDIMIHLPVHLAYEARIAGPVQFRWMYPVERDLCTLKSYVRNRNRPEGSIAEAYIMHECLTFSSRYLEDVETKFNKVKRNDDIRGDLNREFVIFSNPGRHLGEGEPISLDNEIITKVHRYVLFNCNSIEPFLEQHKSLVIHDNPRIRKKDVERIHSETFADWFYEHVENLFLSGKQVSGDLRALARGPNESGKRYSRFIINGYRFHVKSYEIRRKTQNSGVVVTAQTSSFASNSDNNPVVGGFTYYGVLKDIIELEYFEGRKVVMFDCDWISTRSAQKEDEYGFTLVNFARLKRHEEPFILASQAQQVFYVEDPTEKGWQVVVKTKPRDLFDMGTEPEDLLDMDQVWNLDADLLQHSDSQDELHDEVEPLNWVREDVEGILV